MNTVGPPVAIAVIGGFGLLIYLSTRGALASIETSDDVVVVRPRGLNALWAMRGSLRIPWSDVVAVEENVPRGLAPSGFRAPGTAFPGVIRAGTYRGRNGKVFWLVGRAKKVTVVETSGPFRALVLQLEPADAASLAEGAAARGRPGAV